MYKEFKLDLSHAQALKVLHGKPIRVRADQLGKGHAHYFHPENHKKLVKAYEANKGTTLHMTHGEVLRTHQSGLSGSGFWGDLWNGVKKGFKYAKDSGLLSMIADRAVPAVATAFGQPELAGPARVGVKALTGVGMEQDTEGGKLTIKDIRKGASRVYGYAKKKGIVTDVVDAGEKYLLSKSENPQHHEMIRSVCKGIRGRFGVAPSTRIGNWNEDMMLEEARMKEFTLRKAQGSLLATHTLKAAFLNQKAPRSFDPDGYIRFNQAVALGHLESDALLACNIFEETPSIGSDEFLVTAISANSSVSRNTFRLVSPQAWKTAVARGDGFDFNAPAEPLRYDEPFFNMCNEALLADDKSVLLKPSLFLKSGLKTEQSMSPITYKQRVYEISSKTKASTLWSNIQRVEAFVLDEISK
ncbi:unnamed protein product [Phytophthora lilii]|uniref:Unnamed protein product n=1 Tax=Phytophthora lilii TaxID=2077276 RepID=A0A9W6YKD0_9STRA|nr:unnamed protein product [Phytophthora lilii]